MGTWQGRQHHVVSVGAATTRTQTPRIGQTNWRAGEQAHLAVVASRKDRETFASEESRVKMAQLAAAVLANERTAERYARVSDAQTVALNEFIDIVDPIMDLPMFNPGVNHNETVAEAEAAVTAAKKQWQAFRDQALGAGA